VLVELEHQPITPLVVLVLTRCLQIFRVSVVLLADYLEPIMLWVALAVVVAKALMEQMGFFNKGLRVDNQPRLVAVAVVVLGKLE
jgi:hypothetical protein